ncbi:unnamed protein product [Linum trigynum]|uniref:CCHC-type domain-containing protein n=1 Tax=Linum trigynum TaxID=586398 RepID=A0AAV2CYI3_9ROSI
MVVWVQFPAFPVHFYHKEILFALGNMLGRAIKLDFHTQHQQRAKFARIAVELDLSMPLVTRIRLDGKWQYIEYENLPTLCFDCGKIGHTTDTCPRTAVAAKLPITGNTTTAQDQHTDTQPEEKVGFGPWMQVTRRSRRGNRGTEKGNSSNNQGDLPGSGKSGKGKPNTKEAENPVGSKNGKREENSQRMEPQRQYNHGKGKTEAIGSGIVHDKWGKEAMEATTGGKGLLGPSPGSLSTSMERPNKDAAQAKKKDTKTGSGVGGSCSAGSSSKPKPNISLKSSSPPASNTITGPNAVTIQLVNVTPLDSQKAMEDSQGTPSTATRTKNKTNQKKGKSKSPKKLPGTVSSKALQVWTPIKDKKSKNRSRLASLTLQEIAAWTGAAQGDRGERNERPRSEASQSTGTSGATDTAAPI